MGFNSQLFLKLFYLTSLKARSHSKVIRVLWQIVLVVNPFLARLAQSDLRENILVRSLQRCWFTWPSWPFWWSSTSWSSSPPWSGSTEHCDPAFLLLRNHLLNGPGKLFHFLSFLINEYELLLSFLGNQWIWIVLFILVNKWIWIDQVGNTLVMYVIAVSRRMQVGGLSARSS